MKEVFTKLLTIAGWAYWIKITTEQPRCTYYFGPFLSINEAKSAQPGFIEDLHEEDAKSIKVGIQRCQPEELTIFDEPSDRQDFKPVLAFNHQLGNIRKAGTVR